MPLSLKFHLKFHIIDVCSFILSLDPLESIVDVQVNFKLQKFNIVKSILDEILMIANSYLRHQSSVSSLTLYHPNSISVNLNAVRDVVALMGRSSLTWHQLILHTVGRDFQWTLTSSPPYISLTCGETPSYARASLVINVLSRVKPDLVVALSSRRVRERHKESNLLQVRSSISKQKSRCWNRILENTAVPNESTSVSCNTRRV